MTYIFQLLVKTSSFFSVSAVLVSFVLAAHCAYADLNVPIYVYNPSGVSQAAYPVSAVLPLPRGQHTATGNFRVTTSGGTAIPAQFSVEKRWTATDTSLREVRVDFLATLTPSERTTYYLRTGSNPTPGAPVQVEETSDSIRVSNDQISFVLSKSTFNLFDSLSVGGHAVVDNSASDGGYMVNRFDRTYRDASPCTDLAPTVYAVEMSGPVKARIRVERPTYIVQNSSDSCFSTFPEDKDPVPGFVYWFDVYYDSPRVRVHHVVLNNGITAYRNGSAGDGLQGYPLAYRETGYSFGLTAEGTTVRVGHESGSDTLDASFLAVQEAADSFVIPGRSSRSTGSYIDIADGEGRGFAVIDPYFSMTYPNGWDFDPAGRRFTFLTAPDTCSGCEGLQGFDPSGSGLYIINDLGAQEKIFDIVMHSTSMDHNALDEFHKLIRYKPVGVTSPEMYRKYGATTDLFGILPPLSEIPIAATTDLRGYETHMQVFGVSRYRYTSCGTGGIAPAQLGYIVERPPRMHIDEVLVYDNVRRPQYIPRYWAGVSSPFEYKALQPGPDILRETQVIRGHYAAEFSTSSYCKVYPIRAHNYPNRSHNEYVTGKPLPGTYTAGFGPSPRDSQHLWMREVHDLPLDNPIVTHFKRQYERYLQSYAHQILSRMSPEGSPDKIGRAPEYDSEGYAFPDTSVRGMGHSLHTLADCYAESGDADTLLAIDMFMRALVLKQRDSGAIDSEDRASFQEGYLAHGILNSMMLFHPEHAVFRNGWAVLFGGAGRGGKPGMIDAIMGSKSGYYTEIGCIDCSSSGTATPQIDPMAVAAYLLAVLPDPYEGSTNEAKAKIILNYLIDYLDDGINGGSRPYSITAPWTSHAWQGESYGVMLPYISQWVHLPASEWEATLDREGPFVGGSPVPFPPRHLRIIAN